MRNESETRSLSTWPREKFNRTKKTEDKRKEQRLNIQRRTVYAFLAIASDSLEISNLETFVSLALDESKVAYLTRLFLSRTLTKYLVHGLSWLVACLTSFKPSNRIPLECYTTIYLRIKYRLTRRCEKSLSKLITRYGKIPFID